MIYKYSPSIILVLFLYFNLSTYLLYTIGIKSNILLIILIICIVIFLISFLSIKNKFSISIPKDYFPFLLFFFYIFLSIFWSPDFNLALNKFNIILLKGLIPILLVGFLFRFYPFIYFEIFAITAIIYSLIISISSGADFLTQRSSLLFYESFSNNLLNTRVVIGSIEDSRILCISILIIYFSYFKNYKKLIYILIIIPGLIATQTRGPLFMLIILIIFDQFKNFIFSKKKEVFISKIIFLFIVSIPFFFLVYYYTDFIEAFSRSRYLIFFSSDYNEAAGMETILLRLSYFYKSWEIFLNSPIFGDGIASTDFLVGYAHNIFLEILAELGIIGLILFLYFFLSTIYSIKLSYKYKILFIASFLFSLISGNLSQNLLIFYFALLPFLISTRKVKTIGF